MAKSNFYEEIKNVPNMNVLERNTMTTNGFSLCDNCFWHRKNCVLHLEKHQNKCNAHTVRENIPLMFDANTAFMLLVL